MKTLFKNTLTVGALFLAFAANATTGTAKVVVNGDKTFNLLVDNISADFSIVMTNEKGAEVYSQSVKGKTTFATRFDVSFLPAGNYFLELEDETRVQEFPIAIFPDTMIVDEVRKYRLFKPTATVRGNLVDVNFLSLNRVGSLNVSLEDAEGNELFNDLLIGENHLGQTYDVTRLDPGKYTIKMVIDDRIYSKTLIK